MGRNDKGFAAPGESLAVFGERLRTQPAVTLAGSNPVDSVCVLFMLGALPVALRDKVVLHLGEDITVADVVKTATLVKSAPAVTVAVKLTRWLGPWLIQAAPCLWSAVDWHKDYHARRMVSRWRGWTGAGSRREAVCFSNQ